MISRTSISSAVPSGAEAAIDGGPSSDWRHQAQHAVTTLEALEAAITLSDDEREGVRHALAGGFPMGITPYYLGLCDPEDPACPIRLQCIPRSAERSTVPGDLVDPLGEVAHEVAANLVQRYPDRALLLVHDRCAVYCRVCTRSRMVGKDGGARSLARLQPALDYLRSHPAIEDVIVSGGDPAMLSDGRIAEILDRLADIDHIQTVRFATRAPVTLPQRIDAGFVAALRHHPALWVMTHFNHPRELSVLATSALDRLADAGVPVMNQTVLLAGVNDDPGVLAPLFRTLTRHRTRPYYLLQADPVQGSAHLRTPLGRGIEIMAALQGRLSGIALPKLIVDTPGGLGKVPIGPDYIAARREGATDLRTPFGEVVRYLDP